MFRQEIQSPSELICAIVLSVVTCNVPKKGSCQGSRWRHLPEGSLSAGQRRETAVWVQLRLTLISQNTET